MSDPAAGFSTLPMEFQRVLRAAEEQHGIRVTSLDQLVGGRSGAAIHLVSVAGEDARTVEHCILKLDRVRPGSRSGEAARHTAVLASAPASFARGSIPDMAFDPVEHDGAVAIFYRIAGQSLRSFRPLSSHQRQSQLSAILAHTTTFLLDGWNADLSFEQAIPPQELLRAWLGFRLRPDGHLDRFLREACGVDPAVPGFLVGGHAVRNPLAYARDAARWSAVRPLDTLSGFVHGDLNTNNLLLRLDAAGETVEGCYLIDFAAFEEGTPLLYDQRYLEMSYLLLATGRLPFASSAALITGLGEADVPDPYRAPVETAGPAAVIAAARRAFGEWVDRNHPSLHDDLWAQYWLAGVAAGLAYCHKPGLGEEQRLAGLLYACANLERFAAAFPLPPPEMVTLLVDDGRLAGGPIAGSSDPPPRFELPPQATPFLGREAELVRGRELLRAEEVRLLTLTGPGGIGKTRLALQLAAESRADFADGLVLVDLAAARDAEQVLAAIARAVGLRATGDRPLLEALTGFLARRWMLLVLDNFEQALPAAPVIAELLQACPLLTLLVTSRAPLHLRGERLLPVPALGLPGATAEGSASRVGAAEAVRFLVERARAVQPDFALTDENAAAVAEVCRRLDGLPLALELAAARVGLLPPHALLDRLGHPLAVLSGGARDLPERQQTLRGTIAWSYTLLGAEEQRLFALLSVFAGATLASIETVAAGAGLPTGGLDVLDGVTSLLDASLLRPVDAAATVPRVAMLETIRAYATERLDQDAEAAAAAHRAHAAHFAELARTAAGRLTGEGRKAALLDLEADVENLRIAWRYWVAAGDLERLQAMTHGLWSLYDARGWYHAAAALTSDLLGVLAATPSTPERARQEILLQTSLARVLLSTAGYTEEVEAAYRRALELCRAYGHVPELLPVLRGLASYYVVVGEFEQGARIGEQILRLAEEQDDAGMRVEGHLVVGSSVMGADSKAGLDHLDRAIAEYDPELFRGGRFRIGNDPGVPCHTTSAILLWTLGFADRAAGRAREALELADRLAHPYSAAYAYFHMGLLSLWRREPEVAEELAASALRIADAQNLEIWRALALCLRGAAVAERGRPEEGVATLERGLRLYRRLKTPPVFWPLLLHVRAGALARAGRWAEAIALLDEALAILDRAGGGPMAADMFRSKGELVLLQTPGSPEAAEPWFRRALDTAGSRDERMLTLRAAVGLHRLLRTQGRADEGRRVLQDAYAALPEGRSTADARDAEAVLAD